MAGERIGILGGTFDPIHCGHILPAEYALNHLSLDRLVLVPSGPPVHRPHHEPAPADDRLAMCRLAAAPLPRFAVSDVELVRREPSYTVLTLEHFARLCGRSARLFLLVGDDNLPHLHTWFRIRDVCALATIVPMPRPPGPAGDVAALRAALGDTAVRGILARRVPGPLIPVSATEVRRRVRAGEPFRHLVPDSVADYIVAHRLYLPVGA
jgi:nicotinate-nucleotide adenylyltransferase